MAFRSLVCSSLLALGGALSVAEDRNIQLGHTIAQTIRKSLREMEVLEHEGEHVGGAMKQAVVESMLGKQEVLTNEEMTKAIAAANRLAEQQLPFDSVCARDWAQPCPDGWTHMDACLAPDSYQGGCKWSQDFSSAGIAEKASFGVRCKAPWPCSNAQCPEGVDYESCPAGWDDIGNGLCQHSSPEESKCGSLVNIKNMDVAQKQEVTRECQLRWKCKESCDRDFSASCPEAWDFVDDLCVAPATYAGSCEYIVNTNELSQSEKQTFASRCGVSFPCVGAGAGA